MDTFSEKNYRVCTSLIMQIYEKYRKCSTHLSVPSSRTLTPVVRQPEWSDPSTLIFHLKETILMVIMN